MAVLYLPFVTPYLLFAWADEEPLKMCPDCPRLMDLTGVDSLKRINDVIRKYNVNNATEHYFVLSSVGRIRASVNTHSSTSKHTHASIHMVSIFSFEHGF